MNKNNLLFRIKNFNVFHHWKKLIKNLILLTKIKRDKLELTVIKNVTYQRMIKFKNKKRPLIWRSFNKKLIRNLMYVWKNRRKWLKLMMSKDYYYRKLIKNWNKIKKFYKILSMINKTLMITIISKDLNIYKIKKIINLMQTHLIKIIIFLIHVITLLHLQI